MTSCGNSFDTIEEKIKNSGLTSDEVATVFYSEAKKTDRMQFINLLLALVVDYMQEINAATLEISAEYETRTAKMKIETMKI